MGLRNQSGNKAQQVRGCVCIQGLHKQVWVCAEGAQESSRRRCRTTGRCRLRFRQEFYASLTARADALFELTEAVLCADGPVRSLVELSLLAEHRRGHGALYD